MIKFLLKKRNRFRAALFRLKIFDGLFTLVAMGLNVHNALSSASFWTLSDVWMWMRLKSRNAFSVSRQQKLTCSVMAGVLSKYKSARFIMRYWIGLKKISSPTSAMNTEESGLNLKYNHLPIFIVLMCAPTQWWVTTTI